MVKRDSLLDMMFLEGYHAVFTGNRNGGAPHLHGHQERKGTLLSSCRMRLSDVKLLFFFFLLMRLYGTGAGKSLGFRAERFLFLG